MWRFRFGPLAFCLIGLLLFVGMGRAEDAPTSAASSSLMTPQMQQELFDALDLSGDALQPVRDAVAKGDYAAAEHALAQYYRNRTSVPWTFDPRHPQRDVAFKDPIAEDAVNGKVVGGLVPLPHTFPGNKIDWLYNETLVAPGAPHNFEWQWQLCRMDFWNHLGAAYRATGDEKYARAWVQQFRSFVAQNPVPDHVENSAPSAWRTIECGIRMSGSWPNAFYSFLLSPEFTDEDLALYLHACLGHAHYLAKYRTTGNWLTMEMAGLYTIGALYPEFKEAKTWRAQAAGQLDDEQTRQFLPDGAQFELSPGYHNVALDNVMTIPRLAKQVGRLDELPAGYVAGMERAFDYDLYLMTPDRSLPKFNDSWPVGIKGVLHKALDFFPGRAEYQWVGSDGKDGHAPAETSHAFPWAGFYAMRSGWERDANYGVLRAGPIGYGHCQQDKLDFLIWPYGRELLFSSGGGSYEQSKWRSYATDTYGHNCVIVDGKAQRQQTRDRMANVSKAPIDARWESTPDHDFAAGVYDQGYGNETDRIATQTRRVLFLKPDIFVVADTLAPNDAASHAYQARWHLLTTQSRIDKSTNTLVTTDPGRPNLAIVPLLPDGLEVRSATAQTEPELLGWNVCKDLVPEYVPATTLLHTRQGTGVQNFLTLFLPLKAGEPNPVTSVKSTGPGAALVTLADGRQLAVTADLNPSGGLEAAETLADGTPGRHVKAGESHP
ncbi:MAG: heparinase II/III family protein [Methylacidiphilales bacterium]|nr:heparinase II/III family protein [Candidatus Methylacidiphilales bacterium]